ncbi:large subunit ribosomal protein L36e [Nematocida homosporus]|uniref:large subunit ribosomal protein L36e n=1 Tax=Nematocida homosporus TaxID=1912981 RepID=UPI0022211952|nr:large subunit ribosomal protein L36e [Nematocida homosporus]KAI5184390.1 large subunit ribosomal protein L36e [Nematocida homosporus]
MKYNPNTIQPINGELKGNGTIFGRERGHPVKKIISRNQHKKEVRKNPSAVAKMCMERAEVARNIAKEICGMAPYEKKALDFAKKGEEKKMKKFLKKRLGSLKMAKRKQDRLMATLRPRL